MKGKLLGSLVCGAVLGGALPAFAQTVTPTTGAGNIGTTVTGTTVFEVGGGTVSGTALFHSFDTFSPGTTGVWFRLDPLNPAQNSVRTVIARVIGGNRSLINGELRLTGGSSPDLFLINPSGITLGTGAQLSLPGAFTASTADSVVFENGVTFSAVAPAAAPLLTVSTPLGLQFGRTPASITASDVTLANNQGISLIGGDITLDNGQLETTTGAILLGSLAEPGTISLNGDAIATTPNTTLGNILLTNDFDINTTDGGSASVLTHNLTLTGNSEIETALAASTTTPGAGGITLTATGDIRVDDGSRITTELATGATVTGGNIDLTAQSLSVLGGSRIQTETDSTLPSGDITLRVLDHLTIAGFSGTGSISRIQTVPGDGDGGDISVETTDLTLADGGRLSVETREAGNSGNIVVRATGDINIYGESPAGTVSRIDAESDRRGSGNGGNVTLETTNLRLSGGGRISVETESAGDAGDISITARDTIEIAGDSSRGFTNRLAAESDDTGSGQGGSSFIDAAKLRLLEGGRVSVETESSGDAGQLIVRARDSIEILGRSPVQGFVSRLEAEVNEDGSGRGGSILVETGLLRMDGGGRIAVDTDGAGPGGTGVIRADTVVMSGTSPLNPTQITAASTTDSPAGSLLIEAGTLSLSDRAVIEVSGAGSGGAGNLNVSSDRVLLRNGASLRAAVAGGNQGNIQVTARQLIFLRNNSEVITTASGTASGGNITLNAPVILGLNNSDIVANAVQGRGGNINITTQGLLGLAFREQLTPESDITASSEFGLSGTVSVNTIAQRADTDLAELPETFNNESTQVSKGCSASDSSEFIATGRGGIPESPGAAANHPWGDLRLGLMPASDAMPEPVTMASADAHPVEAVTWQTNAAGQVELLATVSSSPSSYATCAS